MTLAWRCASGHVFRSTLARVKRGFWCPRCKHLARSAPTASTSKRWERFVDLRQAASTVYSGKLLSFSYKGEHVPMRWQCEKHHKFTMTAAQFDDALWCPACHPDWWKPHRTTADLDSYRFVTTVKLSKQYSWHGRATRRIVLRELDLRDGVAAAVIVGDITRKATPTLLARHREAITAYLQGRGTALDLIGLFFPRYLSPRFIEMRTPTGTPFGWIGMKLQQNRGKKASIDLFFVDGFDFLPVALHIWRGIEPFANYIMYDGRKPETNVDGAAPGGIMADDLHGTLLSLRKD